MSNELRHKTPDTVEGKLYEAEYVGTDAHIANNQQANDMLYFNGTYWIRATPAQIMALLSGDAAAAFSMNSQKITSLAAPTGDNDAARKKYVDDNIDADITTYNTAHTGAADPHTVYPLDTEAVKKATYTTQGDMLVRGASVPERLAKITTGQYLKATATGYEGGTPAILTASETEVFNGTSPTSWTDLDLSGTVGANSALVILKILFKGNSVLYAVRRDGDTDEQYSSALYGAGIMRGDVNTYQIVVTVTHTDGKLEWICSDEDASVTIDLIAYIK